jgi:hypothetical protein
VLVFALLGVLVLTLARNIAGSDSFHARAMNLGNGETCGGSASIG